MIERIIVHGGKAHLDDLIACALVMAKKGRSLSMDNISKDLETHTGAVPIERRDPMASEMMNPRIVVADVGLTYTACFSDFDHHQISPTATLSAMRLIAQHIRVPGDIERTVDCTFDDIMPVLFPWWRTAVKVDCQGPYKTAREEGLAYEQISPFIGPLPQLFLKMFEECPTPEARGMFVYDNVTRWIDRKIEAYFSVIDKYKIESIGNIHILDFTPADPKLCEDASGPLLNGHKDGVAIFHSTPRREGETYDTTGLTMLRLKDDDRIDFNKVKDDPEIVFTHKSGFLCSTKSKDVNKAKLLIRKSIV